MSELVEALRPFAGLADDRDSSDEYYHRLTRDEDYVTVTVPASSLRRLRKLFQEASTQLGKAAFDAAPDPWQPIETAPKDGTTILVFFKNEIGKSRIVKAAYIPRFHEESMEDWSEYSEERDRYYTPEGWYEQHEFGDEYSAYHIDGVILTCWMPLPKPPGAHP